MNGFSRHNDVLLGKELVKNTQSKPTEPFSSFLQRAGLESRGDGAYGESGFAHKPCDVFFAEKTEMGFVQNA
jgi:hypothetical protein